MSFVDTGKLVVVERKPEWFGRYFHSPNMTFAHYQIVGAGMAAIVLPNVPHSITALTDGKAIVVDYPFRGDPVGKGGPAKA